MRRVQEALGLPGTRQGVMRGMSSLPQLVQLCGDMLRAIRVPYQHIRRACVPLSQRGILHSLGFVAFGATLQKK